MLPSLIKCHNMEAVPFVHLSHNTHLHSHANLSKSLQLGEIMQDAQISQMIEQIMYICRISSQVRI